MATGTESLHHLRKMKRRLAGSNTDRPMEEKFDLLEKTLNVFRSEVDMKLKIMHQILTTRNEQVAVHKKLLDREQILYDTLLGHWKNSANLAATGVTVNFSADDIFEGYNDENNSQSDPDYIVGDDPVPGPSRKKSKSSLRRERNSAKSTRGQLPVQNAAHPGSSYDAFGNQDPLANPDHDGTSTEEWNGEAVDPREQVNVKCETRQANTGGTIEDGESENNFDRTYGAERSRSDRSISDPEGNPINFEKYISTYKKKVTYKISGGGYTYSKRNTINGSVYYLCDQRSICGASVILKNGEYISGKRHWIQGTHLSHPPDYERTDKVTRLTQRKTKLLTKHRPEILLQGKNFLNQESAVEATSSIDAGDAIWIPDGTHDK